MIRHLRLPTPSVLRSVRSVYIKYHTTPNPDCVSFYPDDTILLEDGRTLDFPTPHEGFKSPLAKAVFEVAGVKAVFIGEDYVTVTRHQGIGWQALRPKITEVLHTWYYSGEPVVDAENDFGETDTTPHPDDSDVVISIKELMKTRIRPFVQRDGGNIRYVGIDDGVVFVRLQGACASCPSSATTLKGGIERMLMHWIPEVDEVREVDEEEEEDLKLLWAQAGSIATTTKEDFQQGKKE